MYLKSSTSDQEFGNLIKVNTFGDHMKNLGGYNLVLKRGGHVGRWLARGSQSCHPSPCFGHPLGNSMLCYEFDQDMELQKLALQEIKSL